MRRGIVLGAGGTLGAAWMVARLRALELARGFDARDVDLVIGSSAGSVLAAMITAGVSVSDLLEHQQGSAAPDNPLSRAKFDYSTSVGGPLPGRPPLRPGSVGLLRAYARHPRELGWLTGLAAVMPPGRGSLAELRAALVEATGDPPTPWPERPQLRVAALDYRTGERVAFGEPDAPRASVVDAVIASCSIPGWFTPIVIGGRPYVDVGFRQATSADLAAGHDLDEVIVLSALASFLEGPARTGRFSQLEHRWRAFLAGVLTREISALEAERCEVAVITPSVAERAAMGTNLMDHSRRPDVLATALAAGSEPPRHPPGG